MNLDISKEIQRITTQIIEKYKPDRIILFGSVPEANSSQIAMLIS